MIEAGLLGNAGVEDPTSLTSCSTVEPTVIDPFIEQLLKAEWNGTEQNGTENGDWGKRKRTNIVFCDNRDFGNISVFLSL